MKRLIIYAITSAVLFAGGLAASWYFMLQRPPDAEDLASSATPEAIALTRQVPGDLNAPQLDEAGETELPVPVRGKPLTAEEVFRYGASIRGQYDAMVQRQQEIERDASRLKLMHEDIRGSREELDGLESKLTGLVTMAERLLARLESGLAQMEAEQQQAEQAMTTPAALPNQIQNAQLKNTKRISEIISDMPDSEAAEYLKQLSNDGKLNEASQVLHHIEPRDAAKILGALKDPALMVQLTDEILKNQPTNKKR